VKLNEGFLLINYLKGVLAHADIKVVKDSIPISQLNNSDLGFLLQTSEATDNIKYSFYI
jgi:hypothetical protein